MLITSLMDNVALSGYKCEHGLSLYIKTLKSTILFDMGQSRAMFDNATVLGIDAINVDCVVISHGHYDHTGGLGEFLHNSNVPVYINKHAFMSFYDSNNDYIGVSQSIDRSRLTLTEDDVELGDGILLTSVCKTQKNDIVDNDLFALNGGLCIPDDFRHEQYLIIRENGKRILLSGCSHRGILSIMEYFKPDVFVGGFHFKNLEPAKDRATLLSAAEKLKTYNCKYYTCHCTGMEQYNVLRESLGESIEYLPCGKSINI